MDMQRTHLQDPPGTMPSLASHPDGIPYRATCREDELWLKGDAGRDHTSTWRLLRRSDGLELEWFGPGSGIPPRTTDLLAALEVAFARHPDQGRLRLAAPLVNEDVDTLLRSGILLRQEDGQLVVHVELLWQQPRLWLCPPTPPCFPVSHVLSEGRRHPLRPPKPVGTVYRRHIPWLDRTLSFRAVDIPHDLECFHRWMNEPEVARAWGEAGELPRHRDYLERIAADPHAAGLISCLDGEAFGYFEMYWAREDRIAPFYDVEDFDRGWHVLIGEPRFRGRPFITAWMPSFSHYLFLDDCRTRRIVIEPRVDNHRMIRSLGKCGYACLKEFDFPHKRAMLGMLTRERFFAERLWIPRAAAAAPSPSLL